MLGDYRGAVLDLTKAIDNTENPSWDLFYERGKANIKIKKNSAALEDFNESIRKILPKTAVIYTGAKFYNTPKEIADLHILITYFF